MPVEDIRDAHLVSVSVVDAKDAEGSEERAPYNRSFMVRFYTTRSLRNYAAIYGKSVNDTVTLCNDRGETDRTLNMPGSFVFDQYGPLLLKGGHLDEKPPGDGVYRVYFPIGYVQFQPLDLSDPHVVGFVAYDLVAEPRDVCIFVEGGSLFEGYRSNTFVVPKEAIRAAVAEAEREGRLVRPK
jgi:hypothetical protein